MTTDNPLNILLLELEEHLDQALRDGIPQHEIDQLIRERDNVQTRIDQLS